MNRHTLVRTLADLTATDLPEPSQPFAERLGQWLDFKGALSLSYVLNSDAAGAAPNQSATPSSAEGRAMREAFARVRTTLTASFATERILEAGKTSFELANPAPSAPAASDFEPYQRYYLAQQREMSASVASLRATVRAALSKRSTALKRLAALDAALEQLMTARASSLLATVPALLAKRFEQLRQAQQAAAAEEWLAEFCREMQAVLLAELDLRLQPVAGLIAALDNEETNDR